MTRDEVQAMLATAQRNSVALYLRRQQIAEQAQTIAIQSQQVDRELVRLDGEIAALERLLLVPAEV